jgi:hypothetical protein
MAEVNNFTFTVVDAVITDDNGNTTTINGIPTYHTNTFGRYRSKYPYMAAKKALTSIYKHFIKYPTWFADYDRTQPPQIVFVLKNINNNKLYAYVGSRTQVDEPRAVAGMYGRQRVYLWVNNIQAVDLASVGW